jgi:phage gpG-like protein
MAVVIRGDFHKLKRWKQLFDEAPELMEPISKDGAEELLGKVQDTFREQADPYGKAWPTKKVPDGRSILVGETTRLRRGWHTERVGKKGWVIASSVDYATAHQNPQVRANWGKRPGSLKQLPRRAMVPYKGLPAEWKAALREVARDHLRRHFSSSQSSGGVGLVGAKLAGLKRSFNAIALLKRAVREVQGT